MSVKLFYTLLFFTILIGCGRKSITDKELLDYALDADNGLLQREEKSNTVLEMYYKPKELVMKQELLGISDAKTIADVTARFDSLDYFVLRLARAGKEIETSYASDPQRFNDVINYLSYYMAEDLSLINDRDTVPVLDIVYVRGFGATDATSVMAVFNSKLKTKDGIAKVVFNDQKLGTGLNEFEFNTDDIKNIPSLKQN